MPDATWRPIPGCAGLYEASIDGRSIRSLDRLVGGRVSRRGRVLKQWTTRGGYRAVNLSVDGERRRIGVHIAVMAAFVGPKPNGMCCCHNNGNPADNRLVNLRYDTVSENALDSVDHGTCFQSRKEECPSGHEYNEANTRFVKTPSGNQIGRQCRKCDKERQLAKRAANREAYNAAARERRRRAAKHAAVA